MKARTAAANQLHSVCDTAPDQIRSQLRGLSTRRKIAIASRYRPGDPLTPSGAAKRALVTIARRWAALDAEIAELDRAIKTILDAIAAPLLARHGVGYETAGALLVEVGKQRLRDRLRPEAQHQPGRKLRRDARVAQEVVVGGDDGGAVVRHTAHLR